MRKRKMLRSRCSNSTCRRQFRHADPSAKTCSPACKQAVYRARRKEAAELEAARQEAERAEKYRQILIAVKRRDAERQAAEREVVDDLDHPPEDDPPPEPVPLRRRRKRVHPWYCLCGCKREPETREIVIQMKPHYQMTPLHRGR